MERMVKSRAREVRIGGIYKVVRKIGSGSFGDIYLGICMHNGEEVAIKVESTKVRFPQLYYERRVYGAIRETKGLPIIHYFKREPNYCAMVMELLGPSLEQLFNYCARAFTMKTVMLIGDQMLTRLEYVHGRGFIHRDIKPDNILIGKGGRSNIMYLIDFGLAKKVVDPSSRVHIPYREERSLTGTARYASIMAHEGLEQGRRDDLVSVGYVLIYFIRGNLPWMGLKASTKRQKYEAILEMKQRWSIEQLCEGYPMELTRFLTYAHGLPFNNKPDYAKLRKMFFSLRLTLRCVMDDVFDWSMLKLKTQQNQPNPGAGERVWPPRQPNDDGDSGKPNVFDEKCNVCWPERVNNCLLTVPPLDYKLIKKMIQEKECTTLY